MKKIAIIGCGFSGTMTAVHLINNATHPFELIMIGDRESFNTGIAYNPYSKKHLLNVIASRMSAFQDKPDHFLNWVSELEIFSGISSDLLANKYLPRYLYGRYLKDIWQQTNQTPEAQMIRITIKEACIVDIEASEGEITLELSNGETVTAQYCVIASGNHLPRNPDILNTRFFSSPNYFRNSWDINSVRNHDPGFPVLILGNGLTMADTVMGLVEHGFDNEIHTLSPHGFTILPHSYHGMGYSAITAELHERLSLLELVRIINKHIKLARKEGFTAEPVIDAIRPFTQKLWQNLTLNEKQQFLSRIRYMWESARHRIPFHIHQHIKQLSACGKLLQHAGNLTGISGTGKHVNVRFFDRIQQHEKELLDSGVINCTGPSSDFMQEQGGFLKKGLRKGIFLQDHLKLGIVANPVTLEVHNGKNEPQGNLVAIGSLLKGVLWESTAVKELREQAVTISKHLVHKMKESSGC